MSKRTIEIIKISPCIIPDTKQHNRTPPRCCHLQPDDYQEKFDFKTLSFDTFFSEKKVILSGPPLYGLEKFIKDYNTLTWPSYDVSDAAAIGIASAIVNLYPERFTTPPKKPRVKKE